MKITEYNKANNATTISVIYGIGVRETEAQQLHQTLTEAGYKPTGSQTIDCTDQTKHTINNYTLDPKWLASDFNPQTTQRRNNENPQLYQDPTETK